MDSTVFENFIAPIISSIANNPYARLCNEIPDAHFVELGLHRVVGEDKSGRAFLQRIMIENNSDIETSHFFKALKSHRRLSHLQYVQEDLLKLANKQLAWKDPFAHFSELDKFDIYASDGSYLEWACHDERFPKKVKNSQNPTLDRKKNHRSSKRSCQFFFSTNLRTQTAQLLTVAQMGGDRKKEHDMHALKRLDHESLRFSSPKGRKVLHVYDRAGIDFTQWGEWKMRSGIYFLSREKDSNKLQVLGQPDYMQNDPVNFGVISDEIVGTGNDYAFRRVKYTCPETGTAFSFLTNLSHAIRPGVIVQLYKSRWDVEKMFDVFKNKLEEKKSWATSETAKIMQTTFICLAHNLALLLSNHIEKKNGVAYEYDKKRKEKKLIQKQEKLKRIGLSFPSTWSLCLRTSQLSIKFYRWLRAHFRLNVSWDDAIGKLRALYSIS